MNSVLPSKLSSSITTTRSSSKLGKLLKALIGKKTSTKTPSDLLNEKIIKALQNNRNKELMAEHMRYCTSKIYR